tara:strand:+ start:2453 stop:2737 length:285 start_codon:yes stop_codon:yes gene_type:complete
MIIDTNTLLQIIGLIFSIVGVIWYLSTILSKINAELSKSAQLNTIQDDKINSMDTSINQQITNNYDTCKNGRIDIWKDLNELKLKVAKLEAKEK